MSCDLTRMEYRLVMRQLVLDARVVQQSIDGMQSRADMADQQVEAEAKLEGLVKVMEMITGEQEAQRAQRNDKLCGESASPQE